ncbi:MAG: hypothetical protein NT033_08395 [Candidatus Omnitrophica bacterium]|nr:hypothetical protein [Candidatus Omnitrophota bacterium]
MSKKESKLYDAWIMWSINKKCNFRCVYCLAQSRVNDFLFEKNSHQGFAFLVKKQIFEIRRKIKKLFRIGLPATLRIILPRRGAIDIHALRKVLNKTNRIYRFDLTGGEPFLVPNIIDTCDEITKKHFLLISTNLTSNKIKDFVQKICPERVVGINASCHIKELERLNLLDKYVDNFHLCKGKGFNIAVTERAYPPLLGEVEKYKKFFERKGIELKFDQFSGKYNGRLYPESYTDEEIKIFGLEEASAMEIFHSKGKICNAGYNVCVAFPGGDVRPCFLLYENLGNLYDGIKFKEKLTRCPNELCACPLGYYNSYLFERALAECGTPELLG